MADDLSGHGCARHRRGSRHRARTVARELAGGRRATSWRVAGRTRAQLEAARRGARRESRSSGRREPRGRTSRRMVAETETRPRADRPARRERGRRRASARAYARADRPHDWWRRLRGQRAGHLPLLPRRARRRWSTAAAGRIVIVGSGASYLPVGTRGPGPERTRRARPRVGRFAEYLAAEVGPARHRRLPDQPRARSDRHDVAGSAEDAPWTPPELAPRLDSRARLGPRRPSSRPLHPRRARRRRAADRAGRRDRARGSERDQDPPLAP